MATAWLSPPASEATSALRRANVTENLERRMTLGEELACRDYSKPVCSRGRLLRSVQISSLQDFVKVWRLQLVGERKRRC